MTEDREPAVAETGGVPGTATPSAAQAELRTFLIADIRGYTTYTREHGDEAAAALVNRFGAIVAEVAASHDGFLLELRGDEALVAFVSARKALRAAIELQARFAADSLPRGVGIGLDAGEAIPVGDGYRGTALNLAARLCAQAAAGETLASEAVIHLAAKVDGISYVDARDLKLKGYAEAVRAVVVLPSDRAKGHRLASDRRSPNRASRFVVAVAVVLVLALVGTAVGTFLLNRSGPAGVAATPTRPIGAGATPSSSSNAPASPSSSPDPLGGASLPALAFYNASTGSLVATTPLKSPRNISFYAGGSFWILTEDPNAFHRIDPLTHAVVKDINVPLDEPHGFNFDDDYIWVTDGAAPQVHRIDQVTGSSRQINFAADESDTSSAFDVTVGAGSVWLSRNERNPPEITRINRVTGAVEARIEELAWGLTFGDGALWYWHNGFIGRIDPETNERSFDPVELTHDSYLGNIYFAGDAAWTDSTGTGLVYRIDRFGRYSTYSLQPGIADMAPAADAMWVTNFNTGELTGIDLATGQSDRKINTGHAVIAVASSGDEVMVAVGPTADEVVAGLSGSVLTMAADGIPWWDPAPDPPLVGHWPVRQLLYLTCANLFTYPDASGAEGLTLVPEVATGLPAVSDDGRMYTFTIRPGFKFSPPSNEALTANTFRYSIERALSPLFDDEKPGPRMFGDIVGAKEYRDGTATTVSGLVAIDDQLQITLEAPAPDLLDRLASSVACPVPINGTPALRSGLKPFPPVSGAGPYYLAETVAKRMVVFKANPNYTGDRPQPFDNIAIHTQVAPATALGMVQRRELDAVMFDGGNPLTGASSALAREWGPSSAHAAQSDQRWFGAARDWVNYLSLNPTGPALRDVSVRNAIALGLDRAELANVWADAPAGGLLIPSVRGTDPAAVAPTRDVDAALTLMAGRPVTVTLLTVPEEWDCQPCRDIDEAIKRQLADIGILVEIRPGDPEDYPGEGALDPGSDVDMFWDLYTGADFSDPVASLGGLHDVGWLGRADLDELTRLQTTSGQERIDGAIALAHRLVDEEFLIVPLRNPLYPFFTSDRIGCAFVQPALGAVDVLSLCVKDAAATPAPSASP